MDREATRDSSAAETSGSFADELRTGTRFELAVADGALEAAAGRPLEYAVRGTLWRPVEVSDRPVIVYNHGLQSHQGWFFRAAEDLAEASFPVVAFDRIGSGISDQGASRKGTGTFRSHGHVRTWRLFVATLDRVVRHAGEAFPGRQIALWGNSYGAKIVAAYLLAHARDLERRRVTRAVFTVPGLFQNRETMPLTFSKLRLLLSADDRLFPVPMTEANNDNGAAWFIGPGADYDRIRDDTLSVRHATRRFWLQTRALDVFIARHPGKRLGVPALFLMVDGDRLMDNRRMQDFISRRAGDGSVAKFFAGRPGAKHFLFFTDDREAALADVEAFLDGRHAEIENALPLAR